MSHLCRITVPGRENQEEYKYMQKACKICRREGDKLFLKGDRCNTAKCAFVRRKYPPGLHGPKARIKYSAYGLQLRCKQKIKNIYNLGEKQLRGIFQQCLKHKGNTGDSLLKFLECRLDNVIYRLGLADSRSQAKQLVNHGHFRVNNKKVDIPSYRVKQNDVIAISPSSLSRSQYFKENLVKPEKIQIPVWLAWDKNTSQITILGEPDIANIKKNQNIDTKLVVEYYSR